MATPLQAFITARFEGPLILDPRAPRIIVETGGQADGIGEAVNLGLKLNIKTGGQADGVADSFCFAGNVISTSGQADGVAQAACDAEGFFFISDEAQAVLDRMSALTLQEQIAIVTFVNDCVSDGTWAGVIDCWGLELNSTDYLTAWIGNATAGQSGGSHSQGVGITFGANEFGFTFEGLDQLISGAPYNIGAYMQVTGGDNNQGNDYFGCDQGPAALSYLRWQGSTGNQREVDLFMLRTQTGAPPPLIGTRPAQDEPTWLVGGAQGSENYIIDGDYYEGNLGGVPANIPQTTVYFNGRNSNGSLSGSKAGVHKFWAITTHDLSQALLFRGRLNQFVSTIQEINL